MIATTTLLLLGALAPTGAPAAAATSPALAAMAEARRRLEGPSGPSASAHRALATALTRRARETGDPACYDEALQALESAERLDPGDSESGLLNAWIRMGRHEFAEALRLARRRARSVPADPRALGIEGDALMELGRYDEAEAAYQAMLDLRPGPASWSRAAHLLEVRGALREALDLMRKALDATSPRESEDRAWHLVQIGHLDETAGDRAAAEASYRRALRAFPEYHHALAALAGLRLASGSPREAEDLARQALAAAPHAERHLLLADALHAQGRHQEAGEEERTFESLALAHLRDADNENHDLVLYYLERRPDTDRALSIARREAAVRRDLHTLDRLAWALQSAGRRRAAARLMSAVVATGTRDPLILSHAAALARPDPAPRGGP